MPEIGELGTARPYIPTQLREKVIKAFHDDVLAGHQGLNRTRNRIAARYYWPTMTADVAEYVANCASCAQNRRLGKRTKTTLEPVKISTPWNEVQLDFIGPLPITRDGNQYILTICDTYTKEVELCPCSRANSVTTTQCFKERVVFRRGMPEVVRTDNGTHFMGEFEQYLQECEIKHDFALPYQHNTMGQVERTNRTVEEILRHYVNKEKKNWDQLLPQVQFAINTSVARATGFTPFAMNHGRDPKFPIENTIIKQLKLEKAAQEEAKQVPVNEVLEEINNEAKKKFMKYQQQMIKQEERKFPKPNFKIGDHVMLTKHVPENKLDVKTHGPYRISRKDPEHAANYYVVNPWVGIDSEEKVHVVDMTKFNGVIPKTRQLLKSQEPEFTALKAKQRGLLENAKSYVKNVLKEEWSVIKLIGAQIVVHWTQPGAQGDWSGTIVDYDPHPGRFWVKYDIADKLGVFHYLEGLLDTHPPEWWFSEEEKSSSKVHVPKVVNLI